MGEVVKVSDGIAICISYFDLARMGPDAAQRLEADVKKTINNADMFWVVERDEMRQELRIIPMKPKEISE